MTREELTDAQKLVNMIARDLKMQRKKAHDVVDKYKRARAGSYFVPRAIAGVVAAP